MSPEQQIVWRIEQLEREAHERREADARLRRDADVLAADARSALQRVDDLEKENLELRREMGSVKNYLIVFALGIAGSSAGLVFGLSKVAGA